MEAVLGVNGATHFRKALYGMMFGVTDGVPSDFVVDGAVSRTVTGMSRCLASRVMVAGTMHRRPV